MFVPAKYAMVFRRIWLWPGTVAFGMVLCIRHALYDHGILKSVRPSIPTIAIGNLALGGTGKTPMMELVLRTLEGSGTIATLSRGYGRKVKGIHEVGADDSVERSGDEPIQVKAKFPQVRVFVGADRVKAIEGIQRSLPEVRAVVLDDALQHRRLDPSLELLLTTWQRPYCDDALLPAGKLRDLRSRSRSAQVIVVTKCVEVPNAEEQHQWRERLRLRAEQQLFFSGIAYDEPKWEFGPNSIVQLGQDTSALLFTGIANPDPLVMHVRSICGAVEHILFPDHHSFNANDLNRLAIVFGSFAAGPKTLITTEKDAARLRSVIGGSPLEGLPLAVIGMRTVILNEPEHFADLIRHHVASHPAHR